MVPQTTKFSYVYDELKQRITDGQILPGNRLPSSRQLCDEFQVSLYTINNVFFIKIHNFNTILGGRRC